MLKTICICGAGTMGSGIAQAAASAGFYTVLYDLSEAVLKKAQADMELNFQKLADKGKITAKVKQQTVQLIKYTNELNDCLADIIIEAIVEKTEAKTILFNQLAEINHSETIFATNTSSLSVTEIARNIKNPERVAGMHFFNPAPLMKLVEVVKTEFSSKETLAAIIETAMKMGKTPVLCKDSPGFIVNRVARPYYLESLRMAEEGEAGFAAIDNILECTGFKMGPFRLMDFIGNDINYASSVSVYQRLGSPARLKPSSLQKEKMEKGELGRKTGKGYYNYS